MRSLSIKIFYWLIAIISIFISQPQTILALPTEIGTKLNTFSGTAGYTTTEDPNKYSTSGLAGLIGGMVKILLAFLGVIFLILIIVAGFKWMTTSNPDEIKKIRAKIINATIGLAIILASYALTYFIMQQLYLANPNPALNPQ